MVAYLRRVLKLDRSAGGGGERESVFLYVNSCFAPALDEVVGNLHRVSGLWVWLWGVWDEGLGWINANFWNSALRIRRTSLSLPIR